MAYTTEQSSRETVIATADAEGVLTPRGTVPFPKHGWGLAGWESSDAVVIGARAKGDGPTVDALVRCQVPALTCERVADGPTGPSIVSSQG